MAAKRGVSLKYGATTQACNMSLPVDVIAWVMTLSENKTKGFVIALRSHPGYQEWAKAIGADLPVPAGDEGALADNDLTPEGWVAAQLRKHKDARGSGSAETVTADASPEPGEPPVAGVVCSTIEELEAAMDAVVVSDDVGADVGADGLDQDDRGDRDAVLSL